MKVCSKSAKEKIENKVAETYENGFFLTIEEKIAITARQEQIAMGAPQNNITILPEEQKNIKNINCYSNDGGNWKKPKLKFKQQSLIINFEEKFLPRRGRINCSLNDNGKWRWLGTQFTIRPN